MSTTPTHDWNPETYARFRGLRLRPALDLLAHVQDLPAGPVVDLGCGAGAVAGPLKTRFPGRRLIGVDSSPAMLEQAEESGYYDALVLADAADWRADTAPALIFSNALCQWLPDHPGLFAQLSGVLAQGGSLAVQMPRQYQAPSHATLRDLAQSLFPEKFDYSDWQAPVATPDAYHAMLAPLGRVTVWETTYFQQLPASQDAHPVRRFTESTAMRPISSKLSPAELDRFTESYDAVMRDHYPLDAQGGVLFPFQRLFFTLSV